MVVHNTHHALVECCRTQVDGASAINCCYAARGIRVSMTMTKTVDRPNATFIDIQRTIADGKIPANVSRRLVSPACIAGFFTLSGHNGAGRRFRRGRRGRYHRPAGRLDARRR